MCLSKGSPVAAKRHGYPACTRPNDCVGTAMGRKPKKDEPTDTAVGQHVAFSVAVRLVSVELAQDARHPTPSTLNVIGNALTRVVPVYLQRRGAARPRALSDGELEGAEVMHSATVLVLKDGRSLSSVSIRRRDLKRGIALLRTVGIPELGKARQGAPESPHKELLDKLAEIEKLVRPPLLPSQLDRVSVLAVAIARHAPDGGTAHLAMRLLSALHDARKGGEKAESRAIETIVARLREAIG